MSIDLSTLEREHGRNKSVLFTLIQDGKKTIASAEIWNSNGIHPTLSKAFVEKESREHGLWKFLLEKRLLWLQENSSALIVEAYVPSNSPIIKHLKMNGFGFKDKDESEEERWMVKQLKIA